jgi:hypothetical protein
VLCPSGTDLILFIIRRNDRAMGLDGLSGSRESGALSDGTVPGDGVFRSGSMPMTLDSCRVRSGLGLSKGSTIDMVEL